MNVYIQDALGPGQTQLTQNLFVPVAIRIFTLLFSSIFLGFLIGLLEGHIIFHMSVMPG